LAARERPVPETHQKPDARGMVQHRHGHIQHSGLAGRNCCLNAYDFAVGQYRAVTRKQLRIDTGDISSIDIAVFACGQGKRYPFELRPESGMTWARLISLRSGIYIARCSVLVGAHHYIAYDAWRGILYIGCGYADVLIEESDRHDPGAFEEQFCTEYGLTRALDHVYCIWVSTKQAWKTPYNTAEHYPRKRNSTSRLTSKQKRAKLAEKECSVFAPPWFSAGI